MKPAADLAAGYHSSGSRRVNRLWPGAEGFMDVRQHLYFDIIGDRGAQAA
ncbi:MAG: hypothetical protein H6643_16260 [Caldilineaceae bacterium]|nr:hypothetical protein [Caldilineaceae bacterium]